MSFAKAKAIHAQMGQAIASGDPRAVMQHSGRILQAMRAAQGQGAAPDGDADDGTVPPITGPSQSPAPATPSPSQPMNTGRKGHGLGNFVGKSAGKSKSPHFIQKAIKHPGALHRELGVPQGQKIPAAKLNAAAHSSNPTERKRANLAKTLKKLNHK